MFSDFSSNPWSIVFFLFSLWLGIRKAAHHGSQDGPHVCIMQLVSGPARRAAKLAAFSSLVSPFPAVVLLNQDPVCPVTLFSIPADDLIFYSAERDWTVKWS